MKPSKYNVIIPIEQNKILIYNSMSNAFAVLESQYKSILDASFIDEKKESINSDIIEQLYKGRYLVEDDFDELEFIRYKHDRYRYNSKVMSLTIVPTMDCNFACPYCFEERKPSLISEEVIQGIYKYIERELPKVDLLGIAWFGGEPLLAKQLVYRMSKDIKALADKFKKKVIFRIITNGYYIDNSVVKMFQDMNFSVVQVTIDGPKEIHDKRRMRRDGQGTYDQILEGLKRLKATKVMTSIRVNIDKENWEGIDSLFEDLMKKGLDFVVPYPGHVMNYNQDENDIFFSRTEFSKMETIFFDKLKKYGFNIYRGYPKQRGNYCSADQVKSFAINWNGDLYKCYSDIGNEVLKTGNILAKETDFKLFKNRLKYMNPNLDKKCMECKILPICLGGCPYWKLETGQNLCDPWKYNLEFNLKKLYQDYREMKENGKER